MLSLFWSNFSVCIESYQPVPWGAVSAAAHVKPFLIQLLCVYRKPSACPGRRGLSSGACWPPWARRLRSQTCSSSTSSSSVERPWSLVRSGLRNSGLWICADPGPGGNKLRRKTKKNYRYSKNARKLVIIVSFLLFCLSTPENSSWGDFLQICLSWIRIRFKKVDGSGSEIEKNTAGGIMYVYCKVYTGTVLWLKKGGEMSAQSGINM